MKTRIVTIGDEILIGQVVDTNSAYIALKLNEIGIDIHEILSIQDDQLAIIDTLKKLTEDTELLILTGGLGPTNDDLTKHALCKFLGVDMIYDENVLKEIEERFQNHRLTVNNLNRDQALMPIGSQALPNPLGTAPGIWTEVRNSLIINLPGVPFEMKNLLKTEVIPRLQQRFSLPFVVHRSLAVSHLPESELALKIADWEKHLPKNLHLSYLPESGKVKLRITGHGKDKYFLENEIQTQINQLIPLVENHLDSQNKGLTEEIVGEELKNSGMSISTAESCTGGMMAHLLTSVPGSSKYFKGAVVAYATEIKTSILNVPQSLIDENTVVSEEVAKAMAKGVSEQFKTDIAVSTTGVAGPAKGEDNKEVGTAWISVTNGTQFSTQKYFMPYLERDDFILQISKLALQKVVDFIREQKQMVE